MRHGILALSAALCWLPAAHAGDKDVPDGFVRLFNGKDLSGWKVMGGKAEAWGAEDGVLFTTGAGGGWLMTEKEHADFELRLEFRLPKKGNSGVALRTPWNGHPAYDGMEIQVLDDPNYEGLKSTQHTGSIYDVVPAAKYVNKAVGEWNQMRVVARGRKVTVEVNGAVLVDADLDDHKGRLKEDKEKKQRAHPGLARTTGHLGLQNHGTRLEFRNVFLKPL